MCGFPVLQEEDSDRICFKGKTFDEFQNEGAPPPPQQSDPGLLDKIMLTVLVWLYCGVLLIN